MPSILPNPNRRRAPSHTKQDNKVPSFRKGRPFTSRSKLGDLMNELRISQQELSLRSTIHTRTLYEYISGRQPIPAHHLRQIEIAINIEASEFYETAEELYKKGSLKMTPTYRVKFANVERDEGQVSISEQLKTLPATISNKPKPIKESA